MPDRYPTRFSIRIDRSGLARYYSRTALCGLLWVFGATGFFAGFCFGIAKAESLEIANVFLLIGLSLAYGAFFGSIGALPGWLIYRLFFRTQARKWAHDLSVDVEGPCLRIRTANTDRKLHFRAIVDYATCQSSAHRKCGIKSLVLHTLAGGAASTVTLAGIEDCLRVRDMLAEIDASRENEHYAK